MQEDNEAVFKTASSRTVERTIASVEVASALGDEAANSGWSTWHARQPLS